MTVRSPCWIMSEVTKLIPKRDNMSLYDGVDIDGVPMQSNSTEGTDITKLCKLIYITFTTTVYFCEIDE